MNCLDSGFMAFALCLLADVGALAQGPLGVVATGGSALSSDLVGAATGALSQAQVFSGPFSLVASDPAGRFVYAAAGTTLYGGTIDSGTGILTPIPGFPYSLPGAITALTVEARGRFLYVGSSGDVQAASIDPATGALTLIAGSPFNVGINVSPGASVSGLVSDGAGKYLYATGVTSTEPFFPNNPVMAVMSIDATTGALTSTAGSPFLTESVSSGLAMDPQNRFLFLSGNGIVGYAINGTTGGLTPLLTGGFPFFAGAASAGVSFDGSGHFLYASQSGSGSSPGLLWGFAVDAASGNLTAVPGSPFFCGADCYAVAGDASSQYVYAIDDNGLLAYQIDAATGG